MAFKEGHEKKGGRKAGSQNKLTKTVKEHVLKVFNELQEDENSDASLAKWAKDDPKSFYQIASKLIPTEVLATVTEVNPIDLSKLTEDEIKQLIALHAKIGAGEEEAD